VPPRYSSTKLRQAISNLQREARKVDAANKRAVDDYNRWARQHNTKVRANHQRLQRELARLNSRPATRTTVFVRYRSSVEVLQRSFARIEESWDEGTWDADDELLGMAEEETANSIAVLNTFEDAAGLQRTVLTTELREIDPDLDDRWRGALFALNPANPDAARHFCTSSRQILIDMINLSASDEEVLAANPTIQLTQNKEVPRREKIRYRLARKGQEDPGLVAFVEDDINNVMDLFAEFNPATHGAAGRYDLRQLGVVKTKVEGAIRFLHRIVR
jgi:hypothetical protein